MEYMQQKREQYGWNRSSRDPTQRTKRSLWGCRPFDGLMISPPVGPTEVSNRSNSIEVMTSGWEP
ncbi:MAG: hypothetical protein Kow0010_07820 [Dehalococcoidia bacterium]